MSELDRWTEAVRAELSLGPADIDAKMVLDLARDVAHGVDRPAAPLTTYLLGLAVAQGHTLREAVARISALAAGWGAHGGE